MVTTIWRRHAASCPHRAKGRTYLKCTCPLWGDGYLDGKRVFRRSLDTRDMARARKRAATLDGEEQRIAKTVKAAVDAFLDHCTSEGLKDETFRKYRNSLRKLQAFCERRHLDTVRELDTDALDAFRAERELKPITSSKELQLLRQFCGFCLDRKWTEENVARRIKGPRNLQPNAVVPFTPTEVGKIFAACDRIGRTSRERIRAFAMVLTLRYTALRIGDVATLGRERITRDGNRWRIFLHTEKSGKPVFLPIPAELKAALDAVPLPLGATPDCPYYFWNGTTTSERTAKSIADRTLRAVFRKAEVPGAHAHRFRHTLATELVGNGASFEEVADILGNTPEIARKHYAKWSSARQSRIDDLMTRVHATADFTAEPTIVQ